MRIALLALIDDEGARARIGGRSIAAYQLDAALEAGCERIICLAPAAGVAVTSLSRDAEAAGAKFHAIPFARMLSGLVNAADTLFVFGPGVLADRAWVAQVLGGRTGVATFPADQAIGRGYERIDRDHAWAGVLATRGDAIESLAELPPDADPAAGLLRIALQKGARMVEVPEEWLDDGRWALIPDPAAAARFEPLWLARRVPPPGFAKPGQWIAYHLARRIASSRAMQPRLPVATGLAASVLAASAAVTGYLGHTAPAIVMLVAATMIASTDAVLRRFTRPGGADGRRSWQVHIREGGADAAFLAIAASPSAFAGWPAPFAALVLIAAMRLADEVCAPRFARWFADRPVVFSLALAAAIVGRFDSGTAALGLLGLILRLLPSRTRS